MEFSIEIRRKAVKRFAIHARATRAHSRSHTIGVALIVIIAIQSDKTIFDKKSGNAGKKWCEWCEVKVGKKQKKTKRVRRNISAIKTAAHRHLYFADGGDGNGSGGGGSGDGKRIA